MAFEKFRQEWADTDIKVKALMGSIAVCAGCFLVYRIVQPARAPALADTSAAVNAAGRNGAAANSYKSQVLPETPRNQGLEDLTQQVLGLKNDVARLSKDLVASNRAAQIAEAAASAASAAASRKGSVGNAPADGKAPGRLDDLDSRLPPPGLVYDAPGASPTDRGARTAREAPPAAAALPAPAQIKVWEADVTTSDASGNDDEGAVVIPVNSGLDGVMLTGINARPSGSIAGAIGSVNSANSVGAPFVTRLKGEATLPNGWRLSDLGDCFLGGSGVAVLSAERAYAISDALSCIAKNGDVYEGKVKAYAVDVDGTLGIAGKVVSKQGSLLAQAALTGMISGIGTALSPTTLPSYNSNGISGQTAGVQYPNPAAIAQSAVGSGVNQAASMVSKFYLDYAKEVFPVVEVVALTRVTWVLQESVELKLKQRKAVAK